MFPKFGVVGRIAISTFLFAPTLNEFDNGRVIQRILSLCSISGGGEGNQKLNQFVLKSLPSLLINRKKKRFQWKE